MKEAQRLAMEDALSRAEILAEASGVEVGKPISIQELSYGRPANPIHVDRLSANACNI
jgi:uncharacterized protein YggE